MNVPQWRRLRSGIRKIVFRLLRMALSIAHKFGADPLEAAHRTIGVGCFEDATVSGESFLAHHVLPAIVGPRSVLFDVGANKGDYAQLLLDALPTARILAFEPNLITYKDLESRFRLTNVETFPIGFGAQAESTELITYSSELDSEHASLYEDVLLSFHHAHAVTRLPVELTTLDCFCGDQGIASIDFLKIDTEGHELEVLKGARQLLDSGLIRALQFEFNEMNVASRTFLRDFYATLPNYAFYRLGAKRLIDLGIYESRNEIFRFQNILAVRCDLRSILAGEFA